MKQKRVTMKTKSVEKDYGKDLLDVVILMLVLLGVLWYLNI